MSGAWLRLGIALVSGLLFGAGLVVGGMTDPAKVLGFLNVLGPWDPSLAFVMLGAVTVHASVLALVARRKTPLLAPAFSLPPRRPIDARLVAGALVFGVGWGLSGYCPGPALAALPVSGVRGAAFVLAMALGNLLASPLESAGPSALQAPRLTGQRHS